MKRCMPNLYKSKTIVLTKAKLTVLRYKETIKQSQSQLREKLL